VKRHRWLRVFFAGARGFKMPLILMCLALAVACSAPEIRPGRATGVYHIVKKGETAYSIAKAYSISLDDLAEINHLEEVSLIREGQVLFIPDADQVIEDVMVVAKVAPPPVSADPSAASETKPPQDRPPDPDRKAPTPAPSPAVKPAPAPAPQPAPKASRAEVAAAKGKLAWPVRGTVTTRFGLQPNKTYHNWIRIVCPPSAPIQAAAAGTVIFSAELKDYGETVIIRHANDLATVYTHLKNRRVQTDQSVTQGQVIGSAGVKDTSGKVFMHFEVRLKGKARNPLFYLP